MVVVIALRRRRRPSGGVEKKVRLGVGSRNKYTYSPDSLDEGEGRVEEKGSKEGRSVSVCTRAICCAPC